MRIGLCLLHTLARSQALDGIDGLELALLMLMSSVTTVAWAAYMDLLGHTLGEAIWGSVALLLVAWLAWCAAGVRARRVAP